ncbi:MAG: DUF4160 domain-containing protein [Oscillospiraceae bacterium]|nr:DUF4160 domain-containing protein [Oscillospiraceae bacterium]
MPELSRFQGISIKMLYADVKQHNKPHIHVFYGEYSASVGIDGSLLSGDLPGKQLQLLRAWIILHEEELYASWNSAVQSVPFQKIAPLQ